MLVNLDQELTVDKMEVDPNSAATHSNLDVSIDISTEQRVPLTNKPDNSRNLPETQSQSDDLNSQSLLPCLPPMLGLFSSTKAEVNRLNWRELEFDNISRLLASTDPLRIFVCSVTRTQLLESLQSLGMLPVSKYLLDCMELGHQNCYKYLILVLSDKDGSQGNTIRSPFSGLARVECCSLISKRSSLSVTYLSLSFSPIDIDISDGSEVMVCEARALISAHQTLIQDGSTVPIFPDRLVSIEN